MSKKSEEKNAKDAAKKEAAAKLKAEKKKAADLKAAEKSSAKTTDVYLCSTLSADYCATTYHPRNNKTNDVPRKDRQVLIKGRANVIDRRLDTPYGVVTKITSEELKLIQENCPAFNRQVAGHFITILKSDPSKKDVKQIAADMKKDASRQPTPEELAKEKEKADKEKEEAAKNNK